MKDKLQQLIDSDDPINWELAVTLSEYSTNEELLVLYKMLSVKDDELHKVKWNNIMVTTGVRLSTLSLITALMDDVYYLMRNNYINNKHGKENN